MKNQRPQQGKIAVKDLKARKDVKGGLALKQPSNLWNTTTSTANPSGTTSSIASPSNTGSTTSS